MKYFGNNLKFLRKENNVSQADLSKSLDIERTRLSNWENGTSYPNVEVLVTIAKYFDISIDKLLLSDLENVGNSENLGKNLSSQNVGNDVGNVIGNKAQNEGKGEIQATLSEPETQFEHSGAYKGRYQALLEEYKALTNKYMEVLEGKLIENDFRYKIADIDASVKALRELVINENLQDLPLPSQKEAFFHKKKQDEFVKSGILAGDSR